MNKKVKIHLNKIAQKLLFGYFEGVDWHIDLCEIDPNDKSDNPKYIELSEEEQNRIHDKVLTWIDDYRKKYNGKFSEMEVDSEILFYLSNDSENQAALISENVLSREDVENIYEDYICNKTIRQKRRIKKDKKDLLNEYKLAYKQLSKLSKLSTMEIAQ